MSRLLCPILLLASATVPGAALALGLGELHVESALGQAFVAHIELIDASPGELGRLTAAIADEDTFQRKQLVRPNFLAGTKVSVGQDARGQPILLLRSQDSFTEPVVTFLVDVHWPAGELIREYTALLDPAGLASRTPDAAPEAPRAAPVTVAKALEEPTDRPALPVQAPAAQLPAATPTQRAATAPDYKPQPRSHNVAHGDTLARIAIAAGARSRRERLRMMIAIYRANPAAFQKGFNVLHTGDILRLPSAEELARVSLLDADREYKAQLAAVPRTARRRQATPSARPVPGIVESKPDATSVDADKLALSQRVESLERSLRDVRRELQKRAQQSTSPPLPVRAAPSAPQAAGTAAEPRDDGASLVYRRVWFSALIGGLALLLATGLWWAFKRRRGYDPMAPLQGSPDSTVAAQPNTPVPAEAPSADLLARESAAGTPQAPVTSVDREAETYDVNPEPTSMPIVPSEPEGRGDTGDTTAVLAPEMEAFGDTAEHKYSFYNPDSHLDTTHVVMGSDLTRPLAFVERRKNPAIVLQQAIEREPHRSDLHVKLLELYYASATENRLAFLEAARQIMLKPGLLSAEDWARIATMGRHIAPDDELFRNELDDQAVA